jgi:ABC-type sulfate transport system permease subunit
MPTRNILFGIVLKIAQTLGFAIVVSLAQRQRRQSSMIEISDVDYSTSAAFEISSLAVIAVLIIIYAV